MKALRQQQIRAGMTPMEEKPVVGAPPPPVGMEGPADEEFLVKYANRSYREVEWVSKDVVLGSFNGKSRLRKFFLKEYELLLEYMGEPFDPAFAEVDRVIAHDTLLGADGSRTTIFLVKWNKLPYSDCTWMYEADVEDEDAISKYWARSKVPSHVELQIARSYGRHLPFLPYRESPKYKNDHQLRSYQVEGVNWMCSKWHTGTNAILADEMGLGKTVQVATTCNYLFETQKQRGPFLVVAPLSTIRHWQREFEGWTEMNCVVYHGLAPARSIIREHEFFYKTEYGKPLKNGLYRFNVLVTTYEMVIADMDFLRPIRWSYLVVDEAHRLKNVNSKLMVTLNDFEFDHITLLTGTPLQNNMEELWSLLFFLDPVRFASLDAFMDKYGHPEEDHEQLDRLHELLQPLMLRRLKNDVEKNIAPKEETIIEVELTGIQKKYYRAVMERNFSFLSNGGKSSNVPNLLNVMMELRKVCNHPYLIKGVEETETEGMAHLAEKYEALINASGKMVLINKLLPKLKASGHKVLIFSQMTKVLDLLEDYLYYKNYKYERLDGSIRGSSRQAAIDRFSAPDSDRFVFILCTRAGGVGINLTAADTVIIYDSDWNPQNDLQAQARCHRIGQKKQVKVYRLITRNTYERDMFDRASRKLGLDQAVLMKMQDGRAAPANRKPEEDVRANVEMLLKKGAYGALMDEEDDESSRFCEEDIDQILSRRAVVVQSTNDEFSSFSKAKFSSNADARVDDIDINDPNFWDKFAEKAKMNVEKGIDPAAARAGLDPSLIVHGSRRSRASRKAAAMGRSAATRGGGNNDEDSDFEDEDTVKAATSRRSAASRKGAAKRGTAWSKSHRARVQSALLAIGFARFEVMKTGWDLKHPLEEVQRYCTALLRLIIEACTAPEAKIFGLELLKDAKPEDLMAPIPDLFQEAKYLEYLGRKAHTFIRRLKKVHMVKEVVEMFPEDPLHSITIYDNLWDGVVKADAPPCEWWSQQDDRALLYGSYKHGLMRYEQIRTDPDIGFHGRVYVEHSLKGRGTANAPAEANRPPSPDRDLLLFPASAVLSERLNRILKPFMDEKRAVAKSGGEVSRMVEIERLAKEEEGRRKRKRAWRRETRNSLVKILTWHGLPLTVMHGSEAEISEMQTERKRLVEARRKAEGVPTTEFERGMQSAFPGLTEKLESAGLSEDGDGTEYDTTPFLYDLHLESPSLNIQNEVDWQRLFDLAEIKKLSPEKNALDVKRFVGVYLRMVRATVDAGKVLTEDDLKALRIPVILDGSTKPIPLPTLKRAKKVLDRLEFFRTVRIDILQHPNLRDFLNVMYRSRAMPAWWNPALHDKPLFEGVSKHGFGNWNAIRDDPDMVFSNLQKAFYDGIAARKKGSLKFNLIGVSPQGKVLYKGKDLADISSKWPDETPSHKLPTILNLGGKRFPFVRDKIVSLRVRLFKNLLAKPRDERRRLIARHELEKHQRRSESSSRTSMKKRLARFYAHHVDTLKVRKVKPGALPGRDAPRTQVQDMDTDVGPSSPSPGGQPAAGLAQDHPNPEFEAWQSLAETVVADKEPGLWLVFRFRKAKKNRSKARAKARAKALAMMAGGEGSSATIAELLKKKRSKKARTLRPVDRDASGAVILPADIGAIRVLALGRVTEAPGFHNAKYIWPVGFKTSRLFPSLLNPAIRVEYTSEVIYGEGGPKFVVTPSDAEDRAITADSASGAWGAMLAAVNQIKYKGTGRTLSNSISGPAYFGATDPTIVSLLQQLPGAASLPNYIQKDPATMRPIEIDAEDIAYDTNFAPGSVPSDNAKLGFDEDEESETDSDDDDDDSLTDDDDEDEEEDEEEDEDDEDDDDSLDELDSDLDSEEDDDDEEEDDDDDL